MDRLDTFLIHIMQRALDRFRLQCLFDIFSSQAGTEWVSVPDAYRVIAKLNLDDESFDHNPGRLGILPGERVGHLLTPGMEHFLKRLRGESEMAGVSDKQKDHMESLFHMVYLVPPRACLIYG